MTDNSLPPDVPPAHPPETSDLESSLWGILAQVPSGKVVTYGQLAALCGYPSHARQVGRALKRMPKDTRLPWHRVINSQGKISLGESTPSGQTQRELLIQEGVLVSETGTISLNRFRWRPQG